LGGVASDIGCFGLGLKLTIQAAAAFLVPACRNTRASESKARHALQMTDELVLEN
jgi:hypothetical protein